MTASSRLEGTAWKSAGTRWVEGNVYCRAPRRKEYVCQGLLQPCMWNTRSPPLEAIGGKGRAGLIHPNPCGTGAKSPDGEFKVTRRPRSVWVSPSDSACPPEHPIWNLRGCQSVPPSCRCGRCPGQVPGKQGGAHWFRQSSSQERAKQGRL